MSNEKLFKVHLPSSPRGKYSILAAITPGRFVTANMIATKAEAKATCDAMNAAVDNHVEKAVAEAVREVKSAEKPISESVKAIVDAYFSNFHKHAANFVVEAESKLKLSGNSRAFMFSGSSWHPNVTPPLPGFPPQLLDFMPSLSDLYAGVDPEELEAFKKLTAEYLEAAMDIRNKMLKAREAAAKSQQSATVPPFQVLPHPHFNYDPSK